MEQEEMVEILATLADKFLETGPIDHDLFVLITGNKKSNGEWQSVSIDPSPQRIIDQETMCVAATILKSRGESVRAMIFASNGLMPKLSLEPVTTLTLLTADNKHHCLIVRHKINDIITANNTARKDIGDLKSAFLAYRTYSAEVANYKNN